MQHAVPSALHDVPPHTRPLSLPSCGSAIAANEKMTYGTVHEASAWASYQGLAPGEMLSQVGLAVWGQDDAHCWLAASPDGLISVQEAGQINIASGLTQHQLGGADVAAWVEQQTGSSPDGLLEIKCPWKASPQGSNKLPPPDWYYMPQVQVLCEILDREWAVLYYWSEEKGSHMTLIHRDRDYFALLWQPHPYKVEIERRSRAMLLAASKRTFTPQQTKQAAAISSMSGSTANKDEQQGVL
eukprot:gene1638-1980_t